MKITIGMATYDDYDGVYFTIQSLRAHHNLGDVEILVVDNFGCDYTHEFMHNYINRNGYIRYNGVIGTAAPRDLIFHKATGDIVLCLDCHVLLLPGAIDKLREFYTQNPKCMDLLQGPMYNDDLKTFNTHFKPIWNDHMWGVWGCDQRGADINNEPFDIPMQGLGLFCCQKKAWLGFNKKFRGFGGEEGYIHEKFRKAGRRTLCAPWLRWVHRFGRPYGVSYALNIDDRIRNYLIGHKELGLDPQPVFEHFSQYVSHRKLTNIANEVGSAMPVKS